MRSSGGGPAWLLAEPAVREVAAGLLAARGVREVLDLGCGRGRHALLLARAGFAVSALDRDHAALASLRARARAEGLDAAAAGGCATALPYADAGFDYVLAFNLLPHGTAATARATLEEIHRVLRPGGLVHATLLSKRDAGWAPGAAAPPLHADAAEVVAMLGGFEPLRLEDQAHARPGTRYWHVLAERRHPDARGH